MQTQREVAVVRRSKATVVLECGDDGFEVEALLDTGAEVSVVAMATVEAGGWEVRPSGVKVLEGVAPGAAKVMVKGRVVVSVRVAGSGVEGDIDAQVVESLPDGFPPLLVGLDALTVNRWSVVWSEDGYRVEVARVAVVKVQDGEAEEVVYAAPVGVEMDDQGEDTMPPPVLQQTEVKAEIDKRIEELGKDDAMSAAEWEELRTLLNRR